MNDADMNALMQRLHSDPEICGGQMCIKGTRIPVSLILDTLAGGDTIEDLLRGYPSLKRDEERDVAGQPWILEENPARNWTP
jgi:uncharacterized protein (DUF433 family)